MNRDNRIKQLSAKPPASAATGRRAFLTRSAGITAATAIAGLATHAGAAADEALPAVPRSMLTPGTPMRGYGQPSKFEEPVKRFVARPYGAIAPGVGPSATPLESLEGIITPSGLHFERHHNGVPDINRSDHRLMIHGMLRRPLVFSMEALDRYPMVSRTWFIECAGNSN